MGSLGDFCSPINTHTDRVFLSGFWGPTLGCTIVVHPCSIPLRRCTSREASLHQVVPEQSPFGAVPPVASATGKADQGDPVRFVFSTSMGCHGLLMRWEMETKFSGHFHNVQYIYRNQKSWKTHGNQLGRVKIGQNMGIPFIKMNRFFTQP